MHSPEKGFLNRRYILASGSPRRISLLKNIIPEFEIVRPSVDESHRVPEGKDAREVIVDNAREKAMAVYRELLSGNPERGAVEQTVVMGFDTAAVMDRRIIGKPTDHEDAVRILKGFSGREHNVVTGVAIVYGSRDSGIQTGRDTTGPAAAPLIHTFHETTLVRFMELSHEEIRDYVKQEHTLDKAGAYAIQEHGGVFVERIEGCYFNVIGLPMARLYRELRQLLLLL